MLKIPGKKDFAKIPIITEVITKILFITYLLLCYKVNFEASFKKNFISWHCAHSHIKTNYHRTLKVSILLIFMHTFTLNLNLA